MDPLTTGIQQLIVYGCASMWLFWFALAVGEFLTRVVLHALTDWIE